MLFIFQESNLLKMWFCIAAIDHSYFILLAPVMATSLPTSR